MVEMTALNNNGIKNNNKQSKKKQQNKNQQQSVQHSNNRGRYSSNTYSQLLNNNPKEEFDVENTIDRVLDTIPVAEHGQSQRHKTHEEFYNLNNSESSDDESSYDDDDEERPLRGRSNSTNSSLHIISPTTTTTFTSRIEQCYNKTIIILITLLSILFLRDHTPWYKRYQSKLAEERYQNNHVPDPMKVYNSADDDSTQARDHDPTNVYVKKKMKKHDDVNDDDDDKKKKNVYNRVSAGERISDRPAKKR